MKIKLTKSQEKLFSHHGSVIITPEGVRYSFLPFWIKEVEGSAHEILNPENLPKDLVSMISREGEGAKKNVDRDSFFRKYPLTEKEAFKKH
jgi:hypothetical protein